MGQLNMKEDIGEATIVSPYISLTGGWGTDEITTIGNAVHLQMLDHEVFRSGGAAHRYFLPAYTLPDANSKSGAG